MLRYVYEEEVCKSKEVDVAKLPKNEKLGALSNQILPPHLLKKLPSYIPLQNKNPKTEICFIHDFHRSPLPSTSINPTLPSVQETSQGGCMGMGSRWDRQVSIGRPPPPFHKSKQLRVSGVCTRVCPERQGSYHMYKYITPPTLPPPTLSVSLPFLPFPQPTSLTPPQIKGFHPRGTKYRSFTIRIKHLRKTPPPLLQAVLSAHPTCPLSPSLVPVPILSNPVWVGRGKFEENEQRIYMYGVCRDQRRRKGRN